jgi:hypothetical protein
MLCLLLGARRATMTMPILEESSFNVLASMQNVHSFAERVFVGLTWKLSCWLHPLVMRGHKAQQKICPTV